MGIRRAVHEGLAGFDPVTLLYIDVLPLRNQVFLCISHVVSHDDFPHALHIAAVFHGAVDLVDDGMFLWLPRFEEFGDARQTARDVLGLRGFPWNLRQDVAGEHDLVLFHEDVRADRQDIACRGLPGLVLDGNAGTIRGAGVIDDHFAGQARHLIEFLAHRHAFLNVPERDLAAYFRQNQQGIGIPFHDALTDADRLAITYLDPRAVDHGILFALAPGFIDDGNLPVPAHDHPVALFILHGNGIAGQIRVFLGIKAQILHSSGMFRF